MTDAPQPSASLTQTQSPTYPWYLRGVVVHGHGRGGTTLGYPTANLQLDEPTIAALQAYNNLVLFGYGCLEPHPPQTTATAADHGPFPFAMSVGYNPQFKDVALSAEVHFLRTFPEDFYGHVIRIVVLDSIRPMYAFKSLDELISTINNDVTKTQERLKEDAVMAFARDPFVLPDTELPAEARAKTPYFTK